MYLIAYLTEKYGTDSYITDLVDNREIWIMPMFNPDGHEDTTRHNANDIDLNRNYGYMWTADGGDTKAYGQPETEAMYKWSQEKILRWGSHITHIIRLLITCGTTLRIELRIAL